MNPADLIQRAKDERKEFNHWFAITYCDADGQFTHLPKWFKSDMWEAWRTGRSPLLDTLAANVKELAEAQEQAKHYPTVAGENMRLREELAEIKAELAEFDETNRQMVKHADIRRAELAEIRAENERRDWQGMETAPTDGTVIEAVGRYLDATAGFPRYVMFRDDAWYDCSRHVDEVICWAWRPRTDWPHGLWCA